MFLDIICGQHHNYICLYIFSFLPTDKTAPVLEDVICKHVAKGTKILTDGWASYRKIERLGGLALLGITNVSGYFWDWVNHTETFVNPETGAHTNTIEGR